MTRKYEIRYVMSAMYQLADCRLTTDAAFKLLKTDAPWVIQTVVNTRRMLQTTSGYGLCITEEVMLFNDGTIPEGVYYEPMNEDDWRRFCGAILRIDVAQLESCRQSWTAFSLVHKLDTAGCMFEPLSVKKLPKVSQRRSVAEEIKRLSRDARRQKLIA